MKSARFDWDDSKDIENQQKHHVAFSLAQYAFLDPKRVTLSANMRETLTPPEFNVEEGGERS